MRDGRCDTCGAATVVAARNGVIVGKSSQTGLRPHLDPGFRGAVIPGQVDVWQFACTSCGHLEWCLGPDAIAFVAANWTPVTVSDPDEPR